MSSTLHESVLDAFRRGDFGVAERFCREILDRDTNHATTLELLAEILLRTGRSTEAAVLLQRAIELPLVSPRAVSLFSALCRVSGRLAQACTAVEKGLATHPDFGPLWVEQALLAQLQGRPDGAIEAYRRAIQVSPDSPVAHLNLAALLYSLRRWDEAAALYRRASQLAPDSIAAHIGLGNTLGESCLFDQAIACYQQALSLAPDHLALRLQLAGCLVQLGRVTEAVGLLRETLQHAPGAVAAHSLLLFTLNLCELSHEDLIREHEQINATLRASAPGPAPPARTTPRPPGQNRIRVGFVSPDLRRHSVSYFLEPVITRLDRSRFQVTCYATGARADEVTARLRAHAEGWVNCADYSDEALETRIRHDGIEVLIDLSGHATGGRPTLFARRPAMTQVAFLGYPTSTGLRALDFRISDPIVDPPGAPLRSVERLLRMPQSYFCYRPPEDAPEIAGVQRVPPRAPTLGSFNALAKIGEHTLAAWAAVLRAVPEARLLLKAQGLTGSQAIAQLRARCASVGIDPTRVEVLEWRGDPRSHLECYSRIDIALDTFPYNGATTTCEALWMGVPVVSLSGQTHVSRMGHSILAAAGRAEWVARDVPGFVAACVALLSDPRRLASERESLREQLRASQLMDEAHYVRAFEDLLIDAVSS